MTTVDFYFDTMCPYAHQTSLWIREVQRLTNLQVNWKFFSLEVINHEAGKKLPWEREIAYGWTPLRIAAWLRRNDNELCGAWYLASANALHIEGRRPYEAETAKELLESIGAPVTAGESALADATTHDDVRRDHEHAVSTLGGFGVPIIVPQTGRAIFGPVIVPAPTGDDALRLWELVRGASQFPHFYEMKVPKTADDLAHIGNAFNPYLRAREWNTVQNPAL
ncbi:MAG: DsbA family protein [Ilumatobacteraceae bacterium]